MDMRVWSSMRGYAHFAATGRSSWKRLCWRAGIRWCWQRMAWGASWSHGGRRIHDMQPEWWVPCLFHRATSSKMSSVRSFQDGHLSRARPCRSKACSWPATMILAAALKKPASWLLTGVQASTRPVLKAVSGPSLAWTIGQKGTLCCLNCWLSARIQRTRIGHDRLSSGLTSLWSST